MTFIPRPVLSLSALTLFLLSPFCSAIDNTALGTQTLAKLELRAQQATPRERCFLYADLLHAATVLAGQQILDGKNEEATITLKKIDQYAQLVHLGLAGEPKRLKNTEMLMQDTAYRLKEYLRSASENDRGLLQGALAQLNRIHDELISQLFRR